MIPMLTLIPAAVIGYFVLDRFVPSEMRRGAVLAAVLVLNYVAWSQVVPLDVTNAVMVASYILLTLTAVSPRTSPHRPATVVWLTAIFGGSGVIITLLAHPSGAGFLLRVLIFTVLLTIVALQCTTADARVFLTGILWAGLLQAVFGLVELVIHQPVLWGYKTYDSYRPVDTTNTLLNGAITRVQGTAGHPIPYSVMIGAALLALTLSWRRRRPFTRFAGVILLPTGLVLAGTRSTLTCLAIALLCLLLTSRSGNVALRRTASAVAGLIAALLLFPDLVAAASEIGSTGSWINRAGNLAAIPNLLDRPPLEMLLGSGAESEGQLFAKDILFQNGFNVVDNQFVTVLATQGVLGAALYVALFASGFARASRSGRILLIFLAAMMFSFDYFKFMAVVVLIFPLLALGDRLEATTKLSPTIPSPESATRTSPALVTPRSHKD